MAAHLAACTGSFKHLDDAEPPTEPREFFDRRRPARAARSPDRGASPTSTASSRELFDLLPSNTWVIVTSDHGELFGEDRYFGHGPIAHEKVFEVPFVEGIVP